MMISREIVRRTLDFENPERLACTFGEQGGDIELVGCEALERLNNPPWREVRPGRWERVDAWGNTWARVDPTSKGEVVKGALADLADVRSCPLPDFTRPEDYAPIKMKRAELPDKWLLGYLPGLVFTIARDMRKLENYLVDLLTEPDRIHCLHDRITDLLQDMIRRYIEVGVDGIYFAEDWGTQNQTLVNPRLWDQEYYPRFQRLCATAHAGGLRVFMHSCGQIEAIVPGLIEAGIDVLQFDQPDLHGIDVLAGHQSKAKITYWCPVDIQKTLQVRDERIIRAKAREMLDKLWKGHGGFIAARYPDDPSIGLEPCWQDFACDEFVRYGRRDHFSV